MRNRLLVLVFVIAGLQAAVAADSLRDPTRPTEFSTEPSAAPVSRLSVSAVFISGERRVAIVNGRRVREGDEIAGAIVAGIEGNNVRFVRQGETLVVPLLSGTTRHEIGDLK